MTRRDEYRAYLASPAWAELREAILQRARGVCELCHAVPATQVHHVRYPKRFSDDHPDNLLAVCDRCHQLNHGIRGDVMNLPATIDSYETVTFTFEGRGKTYAFDFALIGDVPCADAMAIEERLYAEDSKCGVHNSPWMVSRSSAETPATRSRRGHLETRAIAQLEKSEWCRDPEGRFLITCSGLVQILANSDSAAGQAFRKQLGDWMQRRVVEAHRQLKAGTLAPAGLSDLEVLNRVVGVLNDHDQAISATRAEVSQIKQTLALDLDPDEFITVRDACAERHKDPTQLPKPGHGWNLEQHVGQALRKQGAEAGPKRQQRLSDQSVVREANTHRRRDVYAAIAAVLGHALQRVA
jgi:hypothetical protein